MTDKNKLQERITFRKAALKAAREAYTALLSGQVQSYAIGSRNLTRLDLEKLKKEIDALERELDELTALQSGKSRRKAVGVVPRDW